METIRIERDLDPEIKRIVTEIACIMGRQEICARGSCLCDGERRRGVCEE